MRHQVEYARRLRRRPTSPSELDVMCVQGEMGTGKTKMVLDEWQTAVGAGELSDLLVVAPTGSYRNWFEDKTDEQLSELRAHLDPRLYGELVVAPWITGSRSALKKIEFAIAARDRPRAMFVNVEALSTTDAAEKLCVEFLRTSQHGAMLAVDESTRIKSGKAERTKSLVRRLRPLAKARRIMTGLITPRSPLDLFWQFYFLDWRILGFESPLGFRNRYAVVEKQCFLPSEVIRARLLSSMGFQRGDNKLSDERLRGKLLATREQVEGNTDSLSALPRGVLLTKLSEEARIMRRDDMLELIPKLGGYVQVIDKIKKFKNLDELSKKIAPYTHRVLKSECLDLKPKIYMPPREVELTSRQRRMYDEVKRYATSLIEGESYVTTTSIITQMIRLHQIVCGHAVDENGAVKDVPSNRVQAVLDVLEDHSNKAIVWATYQREILKIAAAIKKEYGPRSTAVFYGGNKRGRIEDERRFLGDPECRFMVSTQAAGGVGNNWTPATLVVYAANSYDLELRMQSEDRAHRKGQTKSVTYVDLMARGTVEEKIVHALRHKMNLASVINGEDFRDWLI